MSNKERIPELDEAFKNPLERKIAYMIATSHEYKKPNIEAALSFVKNYDWELSRSHVDNLQGINKPVNEAKVADMVKNMKIVKPFIVVDKFQGITPQTKGKLMLIDGHHRHEACKCKCKMDVPVYKGTYTGAAEKHQDELKDVEMGKRVVDKKKVFAIDFDGTICESAFPKIGAPKEKMIAFIRRIKAAGGTVVIWTCREGETLANAIKWLKEHKVPYDHVNSNPKANFDSRKIYADYYVDDKAISADDIDNEKVAMYKGYIEKVAMAMKGNRNENRANKIREAGSKNLMVQISYTDKKGNGSTRTVEPYKIDGEDFWGYDPGKENIRRFKMSKVTGIKHTKQTFTPRWTVELGEPTRANAEPTKKQLSLLDKGE